jgi:hypothetical protein
MLRSEMLVYENKVHLTNIEDRYTGKLVCTFITTMAYSQFFLFNSKLSASEFEKELYKFESSYKFIQRICTMF